MFTYTQILAALIFQVVTTLKFPLANMFLL